MVQVDTLYEYSLFDFDFEPVTSTEEEIQEAFALLVQRKKEKGNYYGLRGIETADIKKYFPIFEERGWMKKDQVRRDLLDYHSVGEVMEKIEEYVDELLLRIDSGEPIRQQFHEITWKKWDTFIPLDMDADSNKSKEKRNEIFSKTKPLSKRIAMKIGLKGYLDNPELRGQRYDYFNSKGYKKYLIPYLETEVAKITDFDEMKSFFKCSFLVGRRDEIWEGSKDSNIKIPPYPEYVGLLLNDLQIAVLCEADESNVKELLKLVLAHISGKSYGNTGVTRYSPAFTIQDYQNSLTDEDMFLIYDDLERLNKLHRRVKNL